MDEMVSSLAENTGTFIDVAWARMDAAPTGPLAFYNDTLGITNKLLSDLANAEQDAGVSGGIFADSLTVLGFVLAGQTGDVRRYIDNLKEMNAEIAAIPTLGSHIALMTGGQLPVEDAWQQLQKDAPGLGPIDPALIENTKKGKGLRGGKKKTGGGGRKKEQLEVFSEGFAAEALQAYNDDLLDAAISQGGSPVYVDAQGRVWPDVGAAVDARAEEFEQGLTLEEQLQEEAARKQAVAKADALMKEFEMHRAFLEQKTILNEEAVRRDQKMFQEDLQFRIAKTAEFFSFISLLSTTNNKALFKIGQAAAIGEAGVNTALGAIKAYQAMAGIPIVGPTVLGPLAAAAVTAAGIAAIAKIKAQKFGGGGAGTTSMSNAGGISAGAASGAFGDAGLGGGGGTIVIPILLDGEQIHEVVVNQNDSANQQGKPSFASA
jgi:hypothetical protein